MSVNDEDGRIVRDEEFHKWTDSQSTDEGECDDC